jgi:hypothetical protein
MIKESIGRPRVQVLEPDTADEITSKAQERGGSEIGRLSRIREVLNVRIWTSEIPEFCWQ